MKEATFLDIFAGAGGLSLGLSRAGWKHLLAVDNWTDAADTYAKNFGEDSIWRTDIESAATKELNKRLKERPDWVVGGPPCQGFSTVGKRQRQDPRNRLFLEFKRVVEDLRPEGFILENVLGLRDMRFVDEVVAAFRLSRYEVSVMTLKAANYGVPQLRRRVIFVGRADGRRFLPPTPTYEEGDYVTVWDAIGDLPTVAPGETVTSYDQKPFTDYQRLMREESESLAGHTASKHPPYLVEAISFIPDGGNRRDIPDEYQPKSGFHNSYSRLSSKAPAVAVTSNMSKPSATRCIHPFQNRGLTSREGARLQSFPDSYHFSGGHVSQRLQIANAVPPILGTAIGEAISDDAHWTEVTTDERDMALFSLPRVN